MHAGRMGPSRAVAALHDATREQARDRLIELGVDALHVEGILNMAVIFGCRVEPVERGAICIHHRHRGDSYTVETSM